MARSLDSERIVRGGLKGSADIQGIFLGGFFLGIEVKTGRGKQTKQQLAFEKMIKSFGGHYFVVSSADEAERVLDKLASSCYTPTPCKQQALASTTTLEF